MPLFPLPPPLLLFRHRHHLLLLLLLLLLLPVRHVSRETQANANDARGAEAEGGPVAVVREEAKAGEGSEIESWFQFQP